MGLQPYCRGFQLDYRGGYKLTIEGSNYIGDTLTLILRLTDTNLTLILYYTLSNPWDKLLLFRARVRDIEVTSPKLTCPKLPNH